MIKYVDEYSTNGNYIENPLGLPYYEQCDSRWGNIKYDIGGQTICSSSSGYTAFSMIAAGYNKDMSITPVTIISKMRNIKLSSEEYSRKGYGSTSIEELTNSNLLEYYKLEAKVIKDKNKEELKQLIMEELNQIKSAIIMVPGHYMVLTPSFDGNVILLDPISNWNDEQKNREDKL